MRAGERAWLEQLRDELLKFYRTNVVAPGGGYFWLSEHGLPRPEEGHQLWIQARMVHCFSIAHLLRVDGAGQIARHGVEWLTTGAGKDHEFGGWFVAVGGKSPDEAKELYSTAQTVLGAASATMANIEGGEELLQEALEFIDRWFWNDDSGAGAERWNRELTELSAYRGMNANMHLCEAYLAAWEATGDSLWRDRALRLAERFATGESPRLPEHFDPSWKPVPEHNRDQPDHPFQPYGSTPGHWLEWAKLCAQLSPHFPEATWLIPRAEELFNAAVADAWAANGGFYYTVDWDGTPVITNRFFWPVTEAIGAAHFLHLATGKEEYSSWVQRLWEFADAHLIDHERGSWFSELDDDLSPIKRTWDGKPDLYHVLQATLYASTPLDRGLAYNLT